MHLLQLNDTVTGFFGGRNNRHGIVTFDWIAMDYLHHKSVLIGDRRFSSCALIKGQNGENLVVVAGGKSPGMEVWNPMDGSVKMLTADFPEKSSETPQLISIEQGRKLIYYDAKPRTGIWLFNLDSNSWTKIGDLLVARYNSVVLPVQNITCP